jgi:uncharacterized protein YfaS (alpha-2-macroglobulin family)
MGLQNQAHWSTTQGNAWALLALTEYATRVEKEGEVAVGDLSWGQRSIPFRLTPTNAVFEHEFAFGPGSTPAPLWLSNASQCHVFAQVKVEARSRVAAGPGRDHGLSLQRAYARLDDENRPQNLSGLRVGDRVLVTLRLTVPRSAHFVAINDALPALFEAINPEFKTQATRLTGPAAGEGPWDEWFSDHRELRSDRALFFCNHLSAGRYVVRYLARVRASGQATAPPAKAEEMYHPERFSLTAPEKVVSAALE